MQKATSSSPIYAWVAWLLFIAIGMAVVLFVPVWQYPIDAARNVVDYLQLWRSEDISGYGLADWQGVLFLLTSLVAMYRIAKGHIQQDGRGWLVCVVGILLFLASWRLEDFPRLACLGLPLMVYGGARHIFGPTGKNMFIPCLILLLIIPLRQITWLEESFFAMVKHVILWSNGTIVLGQTHFFLCDDIFYASVLRDTLTGLMLLFFFVRMSAKNLCIIAMLCVSWSLVAAVCLYAYAHTHVSQFHYIEANTLARSMGWALPLMILVSHVFHLNRKKSNSTTPHLLDEKASTT